MLTPDTTPPRRRRHIRPLLLAMFGATLGCESTTVAPESIAPATSDGAALTRAPEYSPWSLAISVEALPGTSANFNTSANDGCPFVSRDGKSFYMASNRPGTKGGPGKQTLKLKRIG